MRTLSRKNSMTDIEYLSYSSFTGPSSSKRLVPFLTSAWPSHFVISLTGAFSSPDLYTLIVHRCQYTICPDPVTAAPVGAPLKNSSFLVRVSGTND
jgi:hypothetical protein